MAIAIDGNFGFVILALVFSLIVHQGYMSFGVSSARKKYKVTYPSLYASESTKDGMAFNCIQRGHQNSLEWLASHFILTLLVGLRFPIFAALTALIYIAGRIQYFRGYSTGVPKKRLQGSFMYIGVLGQLIGAIVAAFSMLRS